MKSKVIILIALCAILTLSFTFASVKKTEVIETPTSQSHQAHEEPAGGFVSEDKF